MSECDCNLETLLGTKNVFQYLRITDAWKELMDYGDDYGPRNIRNVLEGSQCLTEDCQMLSQPG